MGISAIVQNLRRIEPGYTSWTDSQIEEQVRVINECGYEWVEKDGRVGFIHSTSGIILKIPGLHYYPPTKLRETYENVWSKDFGNIRVREKKVKVIKSIFLTLFSLLTFIFFKAETALIIVGALSLRSLYFYIRYKEFQKSNATEANPRLNVN